MLDKAYRAKIEELLANNPIEEILLRLNVEPVDALVALYEIGELDLERFVEEEESQDDCEV